MNSHFLLFLVMIIPFLTANASDKCPALKKNDRFSEVKIGDKSKLTGYLSQDESMKLNNVISEYHCPARNLSVLRHPSLTRRVIVIKVDCAPPPNEIYASDDPALWESLFVYPLVVVVNSGSIERVNFSGWTFMYESGTIETVSDVDQNGQPEFCLSGTVYECDGSEEDCDSEGESFVEAHGGELVKWVRRKSR